VGGLLVKGLIGKEDMNVQTNTNAAETFTRTTSMGALQTLTKFPDIWSGTGKINVAELEADTATIGTLNGYENIWIPAGAMISLATNGAEAGVNEYASNDINLDYYAFNGATEEYVAFNLAMPPNWDRGTVKAKFYWSSATGSSSGDIVEWEIGGGALSNNDTIDTAIGTTQVISDTLLADDGTKLQVSDATPAVTVGGTPALEDLISFKVSRNVGGTDDMTEDAWLFGVLLQITVNQAVTAW
jgi:hypothetical protein